MLGAFIAISVHHSDIVGARKMVSLFFSNGLKKYLNQMI